MHLVQTGGTMTTTSMAMPSLPASPTLTNPDMILPYGEEFDSPPQQPYRPPSPGEDWRGSTPTGMQFSIGPPSHQMPVVPATPIIYGNGTMLSDIGEVTEAESTPGRKLPGPAERRMLKKQASGNGSLRSSPKFGQLITKRSKSTIHERNLSTDSSSTITSDTPPVEHFKDFDDDGVSVDDSVFQGDDEGSIADSYTEGVIASETERLAKKESIPGEIEDQNSSAALSRRAEQILLNAKKRLNNMEGNLTRARSIYAIPTGSLSSIHSSSPLSRTTPSPQDERRPLQPLTTTQHRQLHTPVDSPMASPGHSRVFSENAISKPKSMRFPVRSASAAARYMNRSVEDLNMSHSPDMLPEAAKISPSFRGPLEALSEDDVMDRSSVRSSIDGGYMSASSEQRTLSRSASQSQMRELRDQMSDLKGRLSVLRDRARDDSMKRRSMQSLRTPSPFTAAEQWYTAAPSYTSPGLSADAGVGLPSPLAEEPNGVNRNAFDQNISAVGVDKEDAAPDYADSDTTSVYEDVEEPTTPMIGQAMSHNNGPQKAEGFDTATNDAQTEDFDEGSEYNEEMVNREELDDYESDSSTYHDTLPLPISHEDREDAFDYEHFFLHSAMGTMSQLNNERRGSFSSDSSVATTRGPIVSVEERPSLGHLRSESTDSVSTMDTFATAEEGHSEEEDASSRYNYAVQSVPVAANRATTPVTSKRSTFGSPVVNEATQDERSERRNSVIYDPIDQKGNNAHRPSVGSMDSFGSTGTRRSFPLINKPTSTTPNSLEKETGERQESPVHMLAKDDQILVERLVASLGQCVLGLQEASRGSYEGRVWRRRLDSARRILEGQEAQV